MGPRVGPRKIVALKMAMGIPRSFISQMSEREPPTLHTGSRVVNLEAQSRMESGRTGSRGEYSSDQSRACESGGILGERAR